MKTDVDILMNTQYEEIEINSPVIKNKMKCPRFISYKLVHIPSVVILLLLSLCMVNSTYASEMESLKSQFNKLETQVNILKKKVGVHDGSISKVLEVQHDIRRTAKMIKPGDKDVRKNEVMPGLTIDGAVEFDLFSTSNEVLNDSASSSSVSDMTVGTVSLGLDAHISKDVSAHIAFLYEEDATAFDIDEATINIASNDTVPMDMIFGKTVVPFGVFDTHLISDSLTLTLAETSETAAIFEKQYDGGFVWAVYLFNGDVDKTNAENTIDTFGFNVGYEGSENLTFSIGYITNIGDSGGLGDKIATTTTTVTQKVPGVSLSINSNIGSWNLIAEYIFANKEFTAGELDTTSSDRKPNAMSLEAAYGYKLGSKDATIAVSFQTTKDFIEQPKNRTSIGMSVAMFDNMTFAAEIKNEKDYTSAEGGTGENANTVTLKLAYEF